MQLIYENTTEKNLKILFNTVFINYVDDTFKYKVLDEKAFVK